MISLHDIIQYLSWKLIMNLLLKFTQKFCLPKISMHLELTYYGEMDKKDDFNDWGNDSYIISTYNH